jgi:hypothetical protein
MSLRFYTDIISQASRTAAAVTFIAGLVLIGFGFMIYLLPRLFATLAAIVFFVGGLGCSFTAIKIFLAQRQLKKFDSDDAGVYRKNVRIHTEEHYDL